MTTKRRSTQTSHRKRPRDSKEDATHVADSGIYWKTQSGRTNPQARNQLVYGVAVLVVAIGAGVVWNVLDTSADPRVLRFWSVVCRRAQCARFVTPVRRTLQAARPIRSGEILSEIPRDQQIWDLDALRDDFVQTHLLSARHAGTKNRLSSGAFLAAYLGLQFHQLQQIENATSPVDSVDQVRKAYFDALPTIDELRDHPLFWDLDQVMELFGRRSLTSGVIVAYHEMVASEYAAFSLVSPIFAETISETNYTLARVWVLTRSFSPGPAASQLEFSAHHDEQVLWNENVMTDFSKGSHAMVPILDMLNHHPSPNVAYQYNADKRAFVITAKRSIPASFELYDSYGLFSDSHLLAKFGFVNGDGSGYTQASMAFFHRGMADLGGLSEEFSYMSKENPEFNRMILQEQQRGLVRYLQFDDGYRDCVPGPEDSDAYRLKEIKLQHLLRIANEPARWTVTLKPRRPNSQPREASNEIIMEEPPHIDARNTRVNLLPLIETCRLMAVIHTDFEGETISILEKNLETPDFKLGRGSDALEYRAFAWYVAEDRRLNYTDLKPYFFVSFTVWLDYQVWPWQILNEKSLKRQSMSLSSIATHSEAEIGPLRMHVWPRCRLCN